MLSSLVLPDTKRFSGLISFFLAWTITCVLWRNLAMFWVPPRVVLIGIDHGWLMYMLNAISLPYGLSLRRADERDHVFMARVFSSTREYLYHMDLPTPYVEALIKQQFTLQCDSYRRQFPHANSFVIQCMAEAIGRVIVEESAASLLIVDLTLLPESCGKGYGTAILQALKAVAETQQCDVKLSVDRQNWRAKKRYAALGFNVVAVTDTHESMVWWPPLLAGAAVE